MNVKSPCLDKCKLNQNKKICDGCFRTTDEISNWNNFSNNEKKVILKRLKIRKLGLTCIIFLMFFFNTYASNNWMGKWIASDQWQSEFQIEIKENGDAITTYGDGDRGKWKKVDGNSEIIWDSGNTDSIIPHGQHR